MSLRHGGDVYSRPVRLDFSVNISPFGLPDGVKEALLLSLEGSVPCRYPDIRMRRLRGALGAHFGQEADTVCCGNGAADLIYALCQAVRPAKGLIAGPAFGEYAAALCAAGAGAEYCLARQGEGFRFDGSAFIEKLLCGDYDIAFLCSPSNPVGRVISRAEIARVAGACREAGTLLVVDECFMGFTQDPAGSSCLPLIGETPGLFVLGAFTKLYAMAGIRFGFGFCSNRALLEALGRVRQPWPVSGLAEEAALAALKEEAYAARVRAFIGAERDWLAGQLTELGFGVFPSGANFLLFQVPCVKADLYEALLWEGILVRPCGDFKGLDASFYRVCVRTRPENEELLGTLRKIGIWRQVPVRGQE